MSKDIYYPCYASVQVWCASLVRIETSARSLFYLRFQVRISNVKVTLQGYAKYCPSHNFHINYPIPFKLHTIIEHIWKVCRAQISVLHLKGQCHTGRSYIILCLGHNFLINYPIPFIFHTMGKCVIHTINYIHVEGAFITLSFP